MVTSLTWFSCTKIQYICLKIVHRYLIFEPCIACILKVTNHHWDSFCIICHSYYFLEISIPPVNEPIGSYQIQHLKRAFQENYGRCACWAVPCEIFDHMTLNFSPNNNTMDFYWGVWHFIFLTFWLPWPTLISMGLMGWLSWSSITYFWRKC